MTESSGEDISVKDRSVLYEQEALPLRLSHRLARPERGPAPPLVPGGLQSRGGTAGARDDEEPRRPDLPHVPRASGPAGGSAGLHRENSTGARLHIIPWVFHRGGEPIKSFRRSWLTACRLAG